MSVQCFQHYAQETIYATIYNLSGQVWDNTGKAFVSYVTANRGLYALACTEQGAGSKVYGFTIPPEIAAGQYYITYFAGNPASPAEADDAVYTHENIEWDGAAILSRDQLPGTTPAAVWSHATRELTSAANITSDGAAINCTAGAVDNVTLVDTCTVNSDMRGTDGANTVTPPTLAQIWTYPTRELTSAAKITSSGGEIGVTAGKIDAVALVDQCTVNADMRGTDGANTVTPPTTLQIWEHTPDRTLTSSAGIGLTAQEVWEYASRTLTAGAFDDVWTAASRTLTSAANITSDGAAINTTAGVIDNVTNVQTVAVCQANEDMRGTDGAYTGTPPTSGENGAAVWDALTTSHQTAGSFGALEQDTNAKVDGLSNEWSDGGRLDAILDQILSDVSTAIDEIASSADAPANPTPRQAAMLVYQWLRNNTEIDQPTTSRKVKNDAGATVLAGSFSDDGNTYQQGRLQ